MGSIGGMRLRGLVRKFFSFRLVRYIEGMLLLARLFHH